jgi:hypothetical protein
MQIYTISSYNISMMKQFLLVIGLFICLSLSIPYHQQLALVNSLQVGREEDPNVWSCVGCDEDNKPLHSYVIEEKSVEIKSILSIYEEYTVLAFRYTANAQNIWQDILWAIQVQDEHAPSGCKVQKQYDNMWASLRNDVINALREHVHTRRLIITGISLGGGLASISFVDIRATKEFENVEVITFGSPRVGNKKWAGWFNSITNSTRIYIREDPIAFLPRCLTLACNYGPTGRSIVCHPENRQCVCKDNDDEMTKEQINRSLAFLFSEINEHKKELAVGDLNGINDHISGYKFIKTYSLVC